MTCTAVVRVEEWANLTSWMLSAAQVRVKLSSSVKLEKAEPLSLSHMPVRYPDMVKDELNWVSIVSFPRCEKRYGCVWVGHGAGFGNMFVLHWKDADLEDIKREDAYFNEFE